MSWFIGVADVENSDHQGFVFSVVESTYKDKLRRILNKRLQEADQASVLLSGR